MFHVRNINRMERAYLQVRPALGTQHTAPPAAAPTISTPTRLAAAAVRYNHLCVAVRAVLLLAAACGAPALVPTAERERGCQQLWSAQHD